MSLQEALAKPSCGDEYAATSQGESIHIGKPGTCQNARIFAHLKTTKSVRLGYTVRWRLRMDNAACLLNRLLSRLPTYYAIDQSTHTSMLVFTNGNLKSHNCQDRVVFVVAMMALRYLPAKIRNVCWRAWWGWVLVCRCHSEKQLMKGKEHLGS